MVSKQSVLVIVLDAREMGKNKDISNFDMGQIVMASGQGQNISEKARIYQRYSEEVQTTN